MIFFLFRCFSEFMCFIQITNSSEHLADTSIYQYIYFSFMLKQHNICACVCPVLPTGDPVSSDQLEGSWPDHLRRTGAGRHLSCPAGQEHSQPLPLRTDAPHYQEERRALRLQDPHLCRFLFLNRIPFHYGGKNILVVIIIIINCGKASASFPLCLWSQCSTLMLLDNAKDPLLFSVIHFKHPKQPHAVQVSVNTSGLTLLSVHTDLCSASFFALFNLI